MPFYLDDDEAREDWMAEREAFEAGEPAGEEHIPPFGQPKRFEVLITEHGLPVVKDHLRDRVIASFITMEAARHYAEMREDGANHEVAMIVNPEWWRGRRRSA